MASVYFDEAEDLVEVEYFSESAWCQRQDNLYGYWAERPQPGQEADDVRCAICGESDCNGDCDSTDEANDLQR